MIGLSSSLFLFLLPTSVVYLYIRLYVHVYNLGHFYSFIFFFSRPHSSFPLIALVYDIDRFTLDFKKNLQQKDAKCYLYSIFAKKTGIKSILNGQRGGGPQENFFFEIFQPKRKKASIKNN